MSNATGLKYWIKSYGNSLAVFVLAIVFAYFGRPVTPWMPAPVELSAVEGLGKFHYRTATGRDTSTDNLFVDDLKINCVYGALGDGGGCLYADGTWNSIKPVQATYFWMESRYGKRFRMLHTLSQDGYLIISSDRTFQDRILSYEAGWKSYRIILIVFSVVGAIAFLIERLNLNFRRSG